MTNEELVEKIQAGEDVQTNMELLYQQNRPLIYKFALSYSEMMDIDDLMQEAYFGLVKAVKKYDSEKEFKFITYAECNIRGHLQRYCYNFGKDRRIPVHMIERISKYHDVVKKYEDEYGEKPSDDYIKQELQINTNQLKALRKTIQSCHTISLDDIIPGTEDYTISDTLADESAEQDFENLIDELSNKTLRADLVYLLNEVLSPQEKDIILKRYGIGCKSISQIQLSQKYGISNSRIGEIERNAIRRLRKSPLIKYLSKKYYIDLNEENVVAHLKTTKQAKASQTNINDALNYFGF